MKAIIFPPILSNRVSVGILVFRVFTGIAMMIHGIPKIQDPFSWMPPTAGVPALFQFLAAIAEFGGGVALVLGLVTPIACLGIIATMGTAIMMVHVPHGDAWIAKGKSFELAGCYLLAAVMLLFSGPGRFSLDACLFKLGVSGQRDKRPTLSAVQTVSN